MPTGILLSNNKKNKILPFVATWIDLENLILNEVRQRKTYITYIWNVKKYNKLVNIAKKETNPQMKTSS